MSPERGASPAHRSVRIRRAERQRGFLLVTAVVLIVIAALLLTVMVFFAITGNQSTVRHLGSKQALFIAGTGLERGIRFLLSPVLTERLNCASITGDANLTNVAFGEGRFTVTGGAAAYSSAPTTLKLAVTATDSTLPVNSLAGYSASGRVLIDRETIDYSSVEATDDALCGGIGRAPCLVGAQRGRDGTAAVTHAAGAVVSQYQCSLQSQGGVPDLVSVRGRRDVQQGIQLQEGWGLGDNGTIVRWAAGPAGTAAWTAQASPVGLDLTDISMLSYADGWAVGVAGGGAAQRPLILYWDGNAWDTRNSNLNINQDLFGIYCVAGNDCWAVGTAGGGAAQRPLILYWNGITWATRNSNLNINEDLFSVHCIATDDCWAVGVAGGGAAQRPLILYWNGTTWATRNSNLNINEDLNDIYCLASNDCWAVGTRGGGAAQRPLILHWDGTAWSTRNSNLNINEDLNGVYCVTSNDCWAVGTRGAGAAQRPLILHWDGSAWSTQNSNLNINRDLMAVQMLGARQQPQAAWRENYQ